MKTIKLERSNKVTLVDDEDFERILALGPWSFVQGYARRRIPGGCLFIHRLLCSTNPGEVVDHIDRDKLNNQKANLRAVSRSINRINAGLPSHNSSGHKYVSYFKPRCLWQVIFTREGKHTRLGYFKTKEEAIQATVKHGLV